jgi:hypothetical protein
MKTLLVGDRSPDNVFILSDPDAPTEAEFELEVAKALSWMYPRHVCIPFSGSFRHGTRCYRPDLALVAKDGSHWFVIEVELVSHSFENHVLPQIRAFQSGEPEPDCASQISKMLGLSQEQAQVLIEQIPRTIAVIANKLDHSWSKALATISVQMLAVSIYRSDKGIVAVEVDGMLESVAEHLGFGYFSATDRSLRFPKSAKIPDGILQVFDPEGSLSFWVSTRATDAIWLTKEVGLPDFTQGACIQLIRTAEGRLSFRRSGR